MAIDTAPPVNDPALSQLSFDRLAQLVDERDPQAFYQAAQAFDTAASRLDAVLAELRRGSRELQDYWTGQLSDSFEEVVRGISGRSDQVLQAMRNPGYGAALRKAGDALASAQQRMRDLRSQRTQRLSQPAAPPPPPGTPTSDDVEQQAALRILNDLGTAYQDAGASFADAPDTDPGKPQVGDAAKTQGLGGPGTANPFVAGGSGAGDGLSGVGAASGGVAGTYSASASGTPGDGGSPGSVPSGSGTTASTVDGGSASSQGFSPTGDGLAAGDAGLSASTGDSPAPVATGDGMSSGAAPLALGGQAYLALGTSTQDTTDSSTPAQTYSLFSADPEAETAVPGVVGRSMTSSMATQRKSQDESGKSSVSSSASVAAQQAAAGVTAKMSTMSAPPASSDWSAPAVQTTSTPVAMPSATPAVPASATNIPAQTAVASAQPTVAATASASSAGASSTASSIATGAERAIHSHGVSNSVSLGTSAAGSAGVPGTPVRPLATDLTTATATPLAAAGVPGMSAGAGRAGATGYPMAPMAMAGMYGRGGENDERMAQVPVGPDPDVWDGAVDVPAVLGKPEAPVESATGGIGDFVDESLRQVLGEDALGRLQERRNQG